MIHPALSHFAIVLPILSLILGMAYLMKPSDVMSKISSSFMVFATLFIVLAFFTGQSDGSEAYPLLSDEGQALLIKHKNFALYILIAMSMTTVVKLLANYKKSFKAEIFSILLLCIVSAAIVYQGQMGGELTYTYGANVEKHSDGMDCLADPKEFLGEEE